MDPYRKLLGGGRKILLFAVLLQSLKYGGTQEQSEPINSCENTLEDPVHPCYRCERHKWLSKCYSYTGIDCWEKK
jgi:hypothetical protein